MTNKHCSPLHILVTIPQKLGELKHLNTIDTQIYVFDSLSMLPHSLIAPNPLRPPFAKPQFILMNPSYEIPPQLFRGKIVNDPIMVV